MTDHAIPAAGAAFETGILFRLPGLIATVGCVTSIVFVCLACADRAGMLHTWIGYQISYHMFDIAKVWKPDEGHHDEWGDRLFTLMAGPALAGYYIAALAQYLLRR